MSGTWTKEADLVADFCAYARADGWTPYAETAGWDVLLVRDADGFQVGIEAKLSLNAKVLCQVLEHDRYGDMAGPDCHAILVPAAKAVNGLETIARRLGVTVIAGSAPDPHRYPRRDGPRFDPELPKPNDTPGMGREVWTERAPDRRCDLPDYVPDVVGGHSAPVQLTKWKVGALKAVVIMEARGSITRAEFRALGIDASRWTQFWLRSNGEGGWVPTPAMPDFKAQHPVNYEQIKADAEVWMAKLPPRGVLL